MKDYRFEVVGPGPLKGASRAWASVLLLAAALVITVPIYGHWLSADIEGAYRFGLALLWGALAFAATRSDRWKRAGGALLSLFGVSLGLALAYVVRDYPLAWLGLSDSAPLGAAVAKLFSEVLPVCIGILVGALLSRRSLGSFGLAGGRAWLSVGLGLASAIPLLGVFAIDPSGGRAAVADLSPATMFSWLPWIAMYSLTNGFMEELWFRGSWFGAFRELAGSPAAMHVTSVAFCAAHVLVYLGDLSTVLVLAPVWLYMGYAYALILRKTGSLWGPVLGHAIADVIYMYIYFAQG